MVLGCCWVLGVVLGFFGLFGYFWGFRGFSGIWGVWVGSQYFGPLVLVGFLSAFGVGDFWISVVSEGCFDRLFAEMCVVIGLFVIYAFWV